MDIPSSDAARSHADPLAPPSSSTTSAAWLAGLWLTLIVISMSIGVVLRPLTEPDEGRNAEVAREMAESNDYVLPRLNALPYVDKPLVYFAVVAGAFELLGQSEWIARLPSVLLTLITAVLVGAFGSRLFGPAAGVFAGAALLTTPLTWAFGQIVILDALFTLWAVAAIIAFYLAVEANASGQRRRRISWSLAAWTAVALAILTKGPVGLILPLLVAGPYAGFRRSLRAVFEPRGLLLATVLVTPWVWLMEYRLPGYLHYVTVVETWQRVSTDALHRSKPFWYFVPMLLIGAFPWSAVILAGLWRAARARVLTRDPRWLFLAVWMLVPLVFFSLSRSKLPQYVLPLVPAFALSAAGLWDRQVRSELPGLRAVSWIWIAVGIGLACALALPALRALDEPVRLQAYLFASLAAAAAIGAGILGLRARFTARMAPFIAALPLLVFYFAALPLLSSVAADRSNHELAAAIRAALPSGGQVVAVDAFPLTLPFYLGQPVDLTSKNGAELTSNYVTATYEQWVQGRSTLHSPAYWRAALNECREPSIFVAHAADRGVRNALAAAGLRLLTTNASYAVYGPCRPSTRSAG